MTRERYTRAAQAVVEAGLEPSWLAAVTSYHSNAAPLLVKRHAGVGGKGAGAGTKVDSARAKGDGGTSSKIAAIKARLNYTVHAAKCG